MSAKPVAWSPVSKTGLLRGIREGLPTEEDIAIAEADGDSIRYFHASPPAEARALAIAEAARVGRDLYKGDGSRLNSYDEGWNDGVDATEQAIRALSPAPSVTEEWIEDRLENLDENGYTGNGQRLAILATLAALGVEVKS